MITEYSDLRRILGADVVTRLEDAVLHACYSAERRRRNQGHEALRMLLSALLATVVWNRSEDPPSEFGGLALDCYADIVSALESLHRAHQAPVAVADTTSNVAEVSTPHAKLDPLTLTAGQRGPNDILELAEASRQMAVQSGQQVLRMRAARKEDTRIALRTRKAIDEAFKTLRKIDRNASDRL